MSDDNVTPLFDDPDDADEVREALREAYTRRTKLILARIRREAANDNRRPA